MLTTTVIQKEFASSRAGVAPHLAKIDTATGKAWCTCPGWRNCRGSVKECKHTRAFVAEWQAGGGTSTFTPPPPPPPAPRPTGSDPLPLKPMLASAPTKGQSLKPYLTPAWVLQVKKDGHRKVVRKIGDRIICHSRNGAGKEPLVFTLDADFVAAFRTLPDGLYDGELMIPVTTSFRATRREFVLFDVVELLGQDIRRKPHAERRELLVVAIEHYNRTLDGTTLPLLTLVEEVPATQEHVDALFAAGEEGGILRRVTSPYRDNYRSADWIKVKRNGHETVTITGFERGKADSSTPWSVTLFRRDNGLVGKCSTKDNETVRQVAANPDAFIGKRLVIDYIELEPASGAFRSGGWDHLAGEGE